MRKIYTVGFPFLFILFFYQEQISAQNVPELMYYKFDVPGATVANMASAPVGTNPAPITGLTIGGTGQFGTGLVGTGLASSTNNVNTGWATNLTGSWTISMWLNIPSSTATRYFFGDLNSGSLRCFSGGVATNNGLRLTGSFTFDITNIGIASGPFVVHYVYDAPSGMLSGYINGVFKNSASFPGLSITGAGPFYVGAYSGANGSVEGTLDEFRLYNRALDAGEVGATWNIELPGSPCASPPTPGTATASPSTACTGASVSLNLTGNSFGAGQTYQWEESANLGGPYTPIGSPSSSPSTNITATTSKYYRCAVTCSGNTQVSVPVQVVVNPAFPGGTYTINPALPPGGGNYQTMAAAVNALSCGISGPVIFNVAPGSGPYNEQVIIPPVGGTSAVNTVTFYGNGATIRLHRLRLHDISSGWMERTI